MLFGQKEQAFRVLGELHQAFLKRCLLWLSDVSDLQDVDSVSAGFRGCKICLETPFNASSWAVSAEFVGRRGRIFL